MNKITVYGADWCSMTTRTLQHLRDKGVPFEYIDVEKDRSASDWVKAQNNGKELKPTVDVNGQILAEPSNQELDRALAKV